MHSLPKRQVAESVGRKACSLTEHHETSSHSLRKEPSGERDMPKHLTRSALRVTSREHMCRSDHVGPMTPPCAKRHQHPDVPCHFWIKRQMLSRLRRKKTAESSLNCCVCVARMPAGPRSLSGTRGENTRQCNISQQTYSDCRLNAGSAFASLFDRGMSEFYVRY